MNENILNEQENNLDTAQEQQAEVNQPATEQENEPQTKTFTQDMVNEIVKNRLEKDRKAFFKRYGVENRDGLDGLIGKSQSYDVMKERYEKLTNEHNSLREKMAFVTNNINPDREDDIRAYFKGKGLSFNEETLVNELATHPEWLNVKQDSDTPQTTIKTLGIEHKPIVKRETEEEKQKRIFGI